MTRFKQLAYTLIAALLLPASSYADDNPVRDYPAQKIAAHTYVIHGPLGQPSVENQGFMNNPGFVITKDGVVVIDPGSSLEAGRMVLRQIAKHTSLPVIDVFDTHIHGDHWLGNQAIIEAYPNAKLLAHPQMIREAQEGGAATWIAQMNTLTNNYTASTQAVIPTIPVVDEQSIQIGDMHFHIYAPENAHSGTDIMIEVVEESVLFTGDNVLNNYIGRLDDGTFKGSIAACNRAIGLHDKHYVPGHGQTGSVAIVRRYRDYLSTLYAAVKEQYDAGKSDFEMKDAVAAKLQKFRNLPGFTEQLGKHISLAVLEIEANQQ
ncbi:MAG: MBL fold metallo-hydrolase [Sulfuriferula sp.]|nr:MBL fold metallo-hydrolase [Sulfuriferula sp.]